MHEGPLIPGLRGRLDPDGAEAAAILLLDDLAPGRPTVDAGELAEFSGIASARDPEGRQST